MPADAWLGGAAAVGLVVALAAATASTFRHLPRAYPRERTRLSARIYRVVRGALAVGLVVGAAGALLALVDTVGTILVLDASRTGSLAGIALLVPVWLGPTMVWVGTALLVGGALVAGVGELRTALD